MRGALGVQSANGERVKVQVSVAAGGGFVLVEVCGSSASKMSFCSPTSQLVGGQNDRRGKLKNTGERVSTFFSFPWLPLLFGKRFQCLKSAESLLS